MKRIFDFIKFILMMFFVICGGIVITFICQESFWIAILLPIAFIETMWLKTESDAFEWKNLQQEGVENVQLQ